MFIIRAVSPAGPTHCSSMTPTARSDVTGVSASAPSRRVPGMPRQLRLVRQTVQFGEWSVLNTGVEGLTFLLRAVGETDGVHLSMSSLGAARPQCALANLDRKDL